MRGLGQIGLLIAVIVVCHNAVEGRSMRYSPSQPPKKLMKMMQMIKQKMRYGKPDNPRPVSNKPDEKCKKVGQFLPIPGEKCKFHVCDYGNEPWRDSYGNIKLFTVEMPCAPGTFVQGQTYGGYPCTGRNNKMCLPTSKPKKYKPQPKPVWKPVMMKPQMMYKSQDTEMTMMMEKQMEAVEGMGYEQVVKAVKRLGQMLESQMYSVLKLTPKTKGEKMDVMVMKEEVEEMSYKATQVVHGSDSMSTDEMKQMCIKMMDMMMDMIELKVEIEETSMTGYGMMTEQDDEPMTMSYGMTSEPEQEPQGYKPMMVVMPVMEETSSETHSGYPMPVEPEMMQMMPQGYGMSRKMKKMKMMVKMMESVMKMVHSGYDMPTPVEMEEEEPMMTGYGIPQMMKMPQGYQEMTPVKPTKMMMKMIRKMMMKPRKMMMNSGYGQTKPKKMMVMMMKKKTKKQEMKPMKMMTGYGQMEMKEPEMMSYGKMEEMEKMMDGGDLGKAIYVIYPTTGKQDSGEMAEMMQQMMQEQSTKKSYWD